MDSNRGGLVAERVKMLNNCVPVTLAINNGAVTHRSMPIHTHNVNAGAGALITPKTGNRSQLRPLRAAPTAPYQRDAQKASSASTAAGATAESAEPLLPDSALGTHQAPKGALGIRVLPAKIGEPNLLSTKASARGVESTTKTPAHSYIAYTVPRDNVGNTAWVVIRHQISSFALRIEKARPTKRTEFKIIFIILLAFLLFVTIYRGFRTIENFSKPTEVDEYFYHLNYNPDELLVYRGETIQAIPKEGILKENNCIAIQRRKKTISNGKSEIGIVSSNEHRTFPGSLLLANQRLVDNSPDPLVVGRAPLTYTVNLPGLTTEGSFTIVPSFSEFQAAVNKVLNTWIDKDRTTIANFQSVESFAYSKQLLRVKFGLDFINSEIETGIDFKAMGKGEKLIKIFKFTQVFYTVSVEPTERPSDLFDEGVTVSEIMRKTDDQPPVLVDSVSYGRNIYVQVETSSIEKQAELNLKFFDTKDGVENSQDLKDLHIRVYAIGGHSNHTELVNVENANEIKGIITKFSKFSKHNLGFPISYSSQFISNNQKAVVHLSTDFVESVRHDNCQKGVIKLIQKVWFGRWEVTWTEITQDENGMRVEEKKGWYKNNKTIKFGFESEDIEVPGNVEDLKVVGKVLTVEGWLTYIDRSNIPVISRREFHIFDRYSPGEIVPPISD